MSTPAIALSIGNFDGVHRGHRRLVEAARDLAGPAGRVVMMTFDPHPAAILKPDRAPLALGSFDDRRRRLLEAGADDVIVLTPTREMLGQSPSAFLEEIVEQYRPDFIVEGPDFRFGRARAGSIDTLRELGPVLGFEPRIIDPVEVALTNHQLVPVSSSTTRWLLARGRVADAACLLGRPFALEARVVPGAKRGRVIGVPTANLETSGLLIPADGVYAGRALVGELTWPAAISIGTNPTFDHEPRRVEAHLVGFDGAVDDYGWTMQLTFDRWLRDQIAYDDVDALVAQIQRDVARAAQTVLPQEC